MHEAAINDICNALDTLRDAFAKHDIPVPEWLFYADRQAAWSARQRLFSTAANGPQGSYFRIAMSGPHNRLEAVGFTIDFDHLPSAEAGN